MTTIEKKFKDVVVTAPTQQKWYSQDEVSNEIITAFEHGKEHMKQQEKKRYEANLNKAKVIAESVYESLPTLKVSCKGIHLRAMGANNFEAIFLIPQKDFLSIEKYNEIYQLSTALADPKNKDKFNFSCLFMPLSKKIDTMALLADGFVWSFGIQPDIAK